MEQPPIPVTGIVKKTVVVEVSCNQETAFAYISNAATLPDWLQKCGPVNGAVNVKVNKGPYTFVGANRTVYFDNGDTILETLTFYNPSVYYSYSITQISNFLKHLANTAYGQWWFQNAGNTTTITWVYTFVPKNIFAKMVLWLFAAFVFKKFMKHSLQLAKKQLEK